MNGLRLGNDQRALRGVCSLDQTVTADYLDPPFRHELERQRIDSMLNLQDASSERFGGMVVVHMHRTLCYERAGLVSLDVSWEWGGVWRKGAAGPDLFTPALGA